MPKKIASFFENQRKNLEHKEIEAEYIRIFNNFDEEVNHELEALNESPQLMNLLAIGEEYRRVCDQIGNDADFKGFYKFIALLRIKDREMGKKMDFFKDRYELENPEKTRVQVLKVDLPKQLSDRFLHSLHSYQEEIKSREEDRALVQKQKEEDKALHQKERTEMKDNIKKRMLFARNDGTERSEGEESVVQKIQLTIVDKLHPELIPENQAKIKEFRDKSTPEQLAQYKKPLDVKEEMKLFEQYNHTFRNHLDGLEKEGNYEHIKAYSNAWFTYSETIAKAYEGLAFGPLKSAIRAAYRALEEWMTRVQIKYEGTQFRNPDEPEVDSVKLKECVEAFDIIRKDYIIQQENKRIWDYIKNEEKIKEKARREEEKAREREELAKRKAIEAEEKERLKAERELQKELDQREKERLAEIKRQEDLKRKEDELKQKEHIRLEKERLAELQRQEEIEQQKKAKALEEIKKAELKLQQEEEMQKETANEKVEEEKENEKENQKNYVEIEPTAEKKDAL